MYQFIIVFADIHGSFRAAEFVSLLNLFNANIQYDKNRLKSDYLLPVTVKSDVDKTNLLLAIRRACLIKYCVELWAEGCTDDILCQRIADSEFLAQMKPLDCAIRTESECVRMNSTRGHKTRRALICKIMDAIPPRILEKCHVDLKGSDGVTFKLIETHPVSPPGAVPPKDYDYLWFGRIVATSMRKDLVRYLLPSRRFLLNTSCDAELAFVISNIAQTRPGDFAIDPFVGSASMLVAAAYHGAHVFGCDFDTKSFIPVEKTGYAQFSNFEQYNLTSQFIDLTVSDVFAPALRKSFKFDAIIADPPYGVRAAARNQCKRALVPGVVLRLMDFASIFLKTGGRLAFWFPVILEKKITEMSGEEREGEGEEGLLFPQHRDFEMVAKCKQPMNSKWCRYLLVFENCRGVVNKKSNYDSRSVNNDDVDDVEFRKEFESVLDFGDVLLNRGKQK